VEPLRPDDPPGQHFQLFSHGCHARLAVAVGDRAAARAWLEAARHVGDTEAALAAARRTLDGTAGGGPRLRQIEARCLMGELLAERGEYKAN
jgi:hypothetical protein